MTKYRRYDQLYAALGQGIVRGIPFARATMSVLVSVEHGNDRSGTPFVVPGYARILR